MNIIYFFFILKLYFPRIFYWTVTSLNKNCIKNLVWRYDKMHTQQSVTQLRFLFFLIYSAICLISFTIANNKLPITIEPKWYNIGHVADFEKWDSLINFSPLLLKLKYLFIVYKIINNIVFLYIRILFFKYIEYKKDNFKPKWTH